MDKIRSLDFTGVAPHRHNEVARRIGIIESYIAGEKTRREAVAELGLTETSFWILVRIWRNTGKPEALLGSGRQQKQNTSVSDLQRQLIWDAEAAATTEPVTQVMARASRLAELRGIELPGVRTMKVLINEMRRGRGLRPDGIVDILVTHCAVDVPVRHTKYGAVAPVLGLVLDIRRQATVLGISLSLDPPSPTSSAKALLDALSNADRPRTKALNEFRVLAGPEPGWSRLRQDLDETKLPLTFVPARPKAWREVTGLLSDRPGGLKLKPDVTGRPAAGRTVNVPQGGSSLDLKDAETIVRGRLRSLTDGPRASLLADDVAACRLAKRLEQLITDEGNLSAPPISHDDRGTTKNKT